MLSAMIPMDMPKLGVYGMAARPRLTANQRLRAGSATALVVLPALMPFMVVIIPMVIVIIVAFAIALARLDDAG
jgi:hypothetical protein